MRQVQREIDKLPKVSGGSDQLYASRRFSQLLLAAEKNAEQFKDEYVSVEHLYLALVDENGTPSSRIFRSYGIDREKLLQALTKVRGSQRVTSQNPEEGYEALTKYGRDLVEMARQGKLDPVIGRDAEIRHTIQILSAARPRTTPSSSASPAWARPPWWRAWPSGSSTATCPRG